MDIKDNLLTLADGNEMPQEGFGLYKVDGQATMNQAVKKAYEDGYRLFDTAQLYGNEQEVGTAFKQLAIPRDNIFVTTKVAEENQGYDKAIESVKESLRKLQMDYVDLLLVHWPIERSFFDTWRAFEEMKKEPYLYAVTFSDFQMDTMSGHFGGEIRLAYLFDGERVRIVTGGSVNGSINACSGGMKFTTERYDSKNYSGPFAVMLPGVRVAGSLAEQE